MLRVYSHPCMACRLCFGAILFVIFCFLAQYKAGSLCCRCQADPYTVNTYDGAPIFKGRWNTGKGEFRDKFYVYEVLLATCSEYPTDGGPDLNVRHEADHTCPYYIDLYYTEPRLSNFKPVYSSTWTKTYAH